MFLNCLIWLEKGKYEEFTSSSHLFHATSVKAQIFQKLQEGQSWMLTSCSSRFHNGQTIWKSHDSEIDNPVKLALSLIVSALYLLLGRLLPLRVFNNLDFSLMYGVLRDQGYFDINDPECVAGILLNRAFNNFEFDDVRKLAAELSGRIHPQRTTSNYCLTVGRFSKCS
ncbi:uncharacterized protein LOC131318367 isoform X2 [Rhododendron vialii]|uniref:uncharacterized protein LOC131318367 isoform X2 n=1 Tax=Rhododendron vialii TaxID=182163 RepID=UPI00265F1D10|nr:uncharacterized protein LOC131318367 isoform X2 [Rhododendron vialii]